MIILARPLGLALLTIKHDAKIESFFRMKSTTKQENKFNFKRNIYIPKMCVNPGPGGLQQVVEIRGTSCRKIRGRSEKNDEKASKVVTFSKLTVL